MNPLQQLAAAGQSPWLDFVRRTLISSGELQRLLDEDAITGLTSNPSIFGKAIGGSTDYDEDIDRIAGDGEQHEPIDVFEDLAIADIRAAADVLRPVYDRTEGQDGFVSFEVDPRLAHDSTKTSEAAKRLFARIDRPNVMIKIPGTPEGVQAIEDSIAAGVNINVTLLFAVQAYERVAEAYLRGLDRRVDAGEPVDRISSVASFFVSRIDSAVDKQLPEGSPLRGTAAIANAKLAYERFRAMFSGERWDRLREAGATLQRPLWASTSTKNPAYGDTLYVEELIGRDTVNTMPMNTIDAFRDHGVVREDAVAEGLDEAHRRFGELREAGVDIDEVTDQVLREGIESFEQDFAKLLGSIEQKVAAVREGQIRRRDMLGPLAKPVGDRIEAIERDRVVERIWRKDHTVWKDDPTEITDRLGWLTVVDQMHERYQELEAFAKQAAADGLETAVLLGMGGSSLAPEVLTSTFGAAEGSLELIVLDTTHPATIARITDALELERTLFVVASKSGTTTETLSHLAHFWELAPDGKRFVVITDPGTPLAETARERRFRAVFENPPDIGGRYSALSYFGLVPAALIGAPLHALLDQAEEMECASDRTVRAPQNPGVQLGAIMGEGALAGRDKLTVVLPPEIASFGSWVEQLIAESTGKQGKGIVPVVGEPLAEPGAYGDDRVFVVVGEHGGVDALEAAGHPIVPLDLKDREQLGGEFFRWELATAIAGHVLGINAFDQPNVQSAKDATKEILGAGAVERAGFDDLGAMLDLVTPGDYLAIQAYIDRTSETEDRLQAARVALRDRFRVATTLGFGPRFLHSTGQLHKGGPNTGVFIQVVDDERSVDVAIPGQPYTFGTLIDAQALGDLRALRAGDRRVARVTLETLVGVV
jgi:transaldolase / glucose-6-phosphate isomerase